MKLIPKLFIALTVVLASNFALSQSYPTKTIKLVVPFPPRRSNRYCC
jgi:tripartite-type tricarboxylate transporter receptor subunit TctC